MGKNWAIAIGINDYYNLTPLHYAKRDAEAMQEYFLQDVGFEKVYYFSDDSPPIEADRGAPTRSQPDYGILSRFLRVRFDQPFLDPGDNFWFFFAGHGKRHNDRDYLLLRDTDPGNIEATALSIHWITERLRRCGADNVILILDACRNQGDRDGVGIGSETQQGVVTLFSCSPNERSYEIDEIQQGAFTHVLLQGLRIQGEGNCATVERLCQHLRYGVPELNRYYKKPRQTPYPIAEPATKLHLILLPKQATLVDVTILKNDALEAEAEADFELAEQIWIRVLAVSPADRQAINAIKRIAVRSTNRSPSPPPPESNDRDRSSVSPPIETVPETPEIPTFQFEVITVNDRGKEIDRQRKTAQYFTEQLSNDVILEMVSIPGGTFQMGAAKDEQGASKDEYPQHTVTVKPFLFGKYAVTQAQWKWVAALPKVNQDLDADPSRFKGSDRPVECVSWHNAIEFCARLSKVTGHDYRLPSEAEWEYACRAGTTTPFHFGATLTPNLANYNGNSTYASAPKGEYREQTINVGSFPPNAFGLYDMYGNVWEWCLDHWHDNYQGAPIDGSAWTHGESDRRLLRGGSWYDYPQYCRSAVRDGVYPVSRNYFIGFRVVCPLAWTL